MLQKPADKFISIKCNILIYPGILIVFEAKTNRVLQTAVTDRDGRFSFRPDRGRFYITVTKPSLAFPSKLVTGLSVDGKYSNLYFGENIKIAEKQTLDFTIPLDPAKITKAKASFVDRIRSILDKISTPVIVFGIVLSAIVFWINTTTINGAVLCLYIFLIILKKAITRSPIKPLGRVYDVKTRKPISGVAIRLFDQKYNKLLETKITDEKGEFAFLLPKGKYYIKTVFYKYSFANNKLGNRKDYYGEPFEIREKHRIRLNIPLVKRRTVMEVIKAPIDKASEIMKPDSIFEYLNLKGKTVSELFRDIKQ